MREWKEAPTLPWFLGWTIGVNYDVFFWARKREAFSSLSSQWSAIFSYPFCLFPLLTLTGLAFSSFPTVLQVVANLTSNSSWLWSTSEVLCFLIWKTWPHKVHAFVPTFFFLSEMCNLPIFFQANFASLLKPCLAMTSSVKSFPAQNADYVVHLFFCIPWFTSPLQDILPIASSVSFVFTFSPFHHSHRIIISFLQTDNYTYHSYFLYHQQKEGLAHIRYQVEFNYEVQMKCLHAFLYKLLPRIIFFKHFFSFLLMD